MTFPPIMTSDGRKAWAFAALVGAAMVFTTFAGVALYLGRANASNTFWNGMAAHAQILVILTALAALLVKRTIKGSKDGFEISDAGEAAQTVADAAQTQASEIKDAAP